MMKRIPDGNQLYDLLVIGGGINGAGVACDAAARGLSTVLLESHDVAEGTSSRSSKLIHGGLRYLEYYDFKLVQESLSERELLMNKARHIAWPLRFVMPMVPQSRPAWMVRLGLFLYDHLAPRKSLLGTQSVRLPQVPQNYGFQSHFDRAFIYSDCWVDDARLVVANLQSARNDGATILTRFAYQTARRTEDGWVVTVNNQDTDEVHHLQARIIVNAAGPWAVSLAQATPEVDTNYSARLVRGSHIIVPKLYEGDHATMLQLEDGRIIVTMPYETDYTLIGTTDHNHESDPREVGITGDERDYLIAAANHFFQRQSTLEDIVWTYAGVRPLFEEGKSRDSNPTTVTRDYAFKIDRGNDQKGAPFLTILGGKLTTYRRLAQHALQELSPYLPPEAYKNKYTDRLLPGGDIGAGGVEDYAKALAQQYPCLSDSHRLRLARTYGSLTPQLLGEVKAVTDLGVLFDDDLYQREVDYLVENEWAWGVDDVLWRRTKCGLRFSSEGVERLTNYMASLRGKQSYQRETV